MLRKKILITRAKTLSLRIKLVSVSEEETEDVTDKWVKDNYNEDYGISTVKEIL